MTKRYLQAADYAAEIADEQQSDQAEAMAQFHGEESNGLGYWERIEAERDQLKAESIRLIEHCNESCKFFTVLMQRAYQRLAYHEADEIAKFLGVPSPIEQELADLKPAEQKQRYRDVTAADLGSNVEFSNDKNFSKYESGQLRGITYNPAGDGSRAYSMVGGHSTYIQYIYARKPL